jgi:hypothetical protein
LASLLYGRLSDRSRRADEHSDLPGPISIYNGGVGCRVEHLQISAGRFIHRLTYRDTPGTSNFGIKIGAPVPLNETLPRAAPFGKSQQGIL